MFTANRWYIPEIFRKEEMIWILVCIFLKKKSHAKNVIINRNVFHISETERKVYEDPAKGMAAEMSLKVGFP